MPDYHLLAYLFFPFDRSLKLWMVLRLYGLENLQAYIRNHIKLARDFEELVAQDSRFEVNTNVLYLNDMDYVTSQTDFVSLFNCYCCI